MKLEWKISLADASRVRDVVREHRHEPLVRQRFDRNLGGNHQPLTRTSFWHGMMLCLLTTQQRSGPGSNVSRFLNLRPFPTSYSHCRRAPNAEVLIHQSIRKHGGIRRGDTIGREGAENLAILRSRRGGEVLRHLKGLKSHRGPKQERAAAHLLASTFKGIGPKQSRNLLQHLGLIRYEIPIDSRIVGWLNEFGFPVHLSATALADPNYYEFISDGVQELCRKARVYPCVFDAAVFSSVDRKSALATVSG